MHATHPDLLGDLGDQLLAAELSLGIRWPVDDHPSRWEQREAAAIDLLEFDHLCPIDTIGELISAFRIHCPLCGHLK